MNKDDLVFVLFLIIVAIIIIGGLLGGWLYLYSLFR